MRKFSAALGSRGVLQNARLMIASFYYATRCIWRAFCKDSASESRAELVRAMPSAAYLIKNAPTCLLITKRRKVTFFLRDFYVQAQFQPLKNDVRSIGGSFRSSCALPSHSKALPSESGFVHCSYCKDNHQKLKEEELTIHFVCRALPSRAETACKCASYTHFFYPEKPFSLSVLMLFNCNLAI